MDLTDTVNTNSHRCLKYRKLCKSSCGWLHLIVWRGTGENCDKIGGREQDGQGHEMVPEEGEQVMGSRRF